MGVGVSVDQNLVNEWQGGFQASLTLKNETNQPVSEFRLQVPADFEIGNLWGGEWSVVDGWLTLRLPSWMNSLAPGAEVNFGFTATGSYAELSAHVSADLDDDQDLIASEDDGFASSVHEADEPGNEVSSQDPGVPLSVDIPDGADDEDVQVSPPVIEDIAPRNQIFTVVQSVVNSWHGGFQGEIVLTNSSQDAISELELVIPEGIEIGNLWGGEFTAVGANVYRVSPPSWMGNLLPGQTMTIGFAANGQPAELTVVGDSNSEPVADPIAPDTPTAEPQVPSDELEQPVAPEPTLPIQTVPDDADDEDVQVSPPVIEDIAPSNQIFTVVQSVVNSWHGGFQGEIVLTNSSQDAISELELVIPEGIEIGNLWGGEFTAVGANVFRVSPPSWMGSFLPGQTMTIGFVANGQPAELAVVGDSNSGSVADPIAPDTPTAEPQVPSDELDQPVAPEPTQPIQTVPPEVSDEDHEESQGETTDPVEENLTGSLSVVMDIVHAWQGGFQAEITVRAVNDLSSTVTDWQLEIPDSVGVDSVWNAGLSDSGSVVYATEEWNSTLSHAGNVIKFGLTASGTVEDLSGIKFIDQNGRITELEIAVSGEDLLLPPVQNPQSSGSASGGRPSAADLAYDVQDVTQSVSPFTSDDYEQLLNMSMSFYRAQEAGELADDHPIAWRGDSFLQDGNNFDLLISNGGHIPDESVDLTGGWFDAGDHVKFGFPMAYSTTALAWGGIDYRAGYQKAGALDELAHNLTHVTDYLSNAYFDMGTPADASDDVLVIQIADGHLDHSVWAAPEGHVHDGQRQVYYLDAANPGSDVAGETAAALAASSIFFREQGDIDRADSLLGKAISLYNFADTYRGRYTDTAMGSNASTFYKSWSGYEDELAWGAVWLHKAVNAAGVQSDIDYLSKAEEYTGWGNAGWSLNWDDKTHGVNMLLLEETGKDVYRQRVEAHVNGLLTGERVLPDGTVSNSGLTFVSEWGSNRYAANGAFIVEQYADYLAANDTSAASLSEQLALKDYVTDQLDFMLGDNAQGQSFVVGFGDKSPQNPHHRAASQSADFVLNGALVGGFENTAGHYDDDTFDYISNEVATDYNALYSGLLAARVSEQKQTGTVQDDTLIGSNFNDRLVGLDADDVLVGGLGADILLGGAGADRFVYTDVNESTTLLMDVIEDFEVGVDVIDLTAFGIDLADLSVSVSEEDVSTILSIDSDNVDFRVELSGVALDYGILIADVIV